MRVIVTQSAERDLEEASDFYERLETGAGAYFLEKMVEEIDALADTGGVHRKVWGYHKVAAVRFPFLIFYLVRDDTVLVRAIVDGRRTPLSNLKTVTQRKQNDAPL